MKKIAVIYWSGTGNTEMMAKAVAEGADTSSTEVKLLSIDNATKQDVLNADAVAFGCPSMGAEVLEEDAMEPFIDSLSDIDFSNKPVALFGSYDWGDGQWMKEWKERMEEYGANILTEGLILHLTPDDDGIEECEDLGATLAK